MKYRFSVHILLFFKLFFYFIFFWLLFGTNKKSFTSKCTSYISIIYTNNYIYFTMIHLMCWFCHWIVSDTCDPMYCRLPNSSVYGILQASILEWVAISFSRQSSLPRDWTLVSWIAGRFFTHWATWEAPWFT